MNFKIQILISLVYRSTIILKTNLKIEIVLGI